MRRHSPLLKHVFAFYIENLQQTASDEIVRFKDATLANRLHKVVRIKTGDRFILFDQTEHITLTAHEEMTTNKRVVAGNVVERNKNVPLQPPITLLLPILKKEALEVAFYVAAQMGVANIVPLITQKSEQSLGEKELDRLRKIMIAACEQSKNFVLPKTEPTAPLSQVNLPKTARKIFFDCDGKPLTKLVEKLSDAKKETEAFTSKVVTLGPEGGFTADEKAMLANLGFATYKLTPTVLRSREAVTVGLGVVASLALSTP